MMIYNWRERQNDMTIVTVPIEGISTILTRRLMIHSSWRGEMHFPAVSRKDRTSLTAKYTTIKEFQGGYLEEGSV